MIDITPSMKPIEEHVDLMNEQMSENQALDAVDAPVETAPVVVGAEDGTPASWLDRSLASMMRWDLERTAWAVLLVAAAAIRLADLGSRSMSHDESEHAWFAYNLYSGRGYEHSPVYHGPFAYHVLALFYMLFGDSTVMARIPTALFGIGVVWLIWPLRRWLGRVGAFLAAVMVTLSPAILHYSRHTRHDMYEIFWALVFIIAVFRYLETDRDRPVKWLYLGSAGLTLMLAIKEVSFIYGALVGGFVLLVILYQWVGWRANPDFPEEERTAPARLVSRDWLVLVAVVVLSFAGMLVVRLAGLASTGYDTIGVTGVLSTLVRLVPMLVPPLAAVGVAAWYVSHRDRDDRPPMTFSSPTDVAVLLGTLILPWLAPFLITAFGYDPLDYNFPVGILQSLSVVLALVGLSAAIGVMWNWRRWLPAAAIFYALFFLFFTTFFTNGKGWATGLVGSLGYWLSQQAVARGSQPWYYYLLIVPVYEFLPIILSLPVVVAAVLRRNRLSYVLLLLLVILLIGVFLTGSAPPEDIDGATSTMATLNEILRSAVLALAVLAAAWGGLVGFPRRRQHFLAFLPFWVVATWIAYTVAGEKMPWLATHISLPMCIAGGWWLGKVVQRVDWQGVRQRGGMWIAVLTVPLLAAVVALLRSNPFRDRTIAGLSETSQWLAALLVGLVAVALLIRQAQRVGWRDAGRIAGLTVVLLLGLWSLRTSYMLNFINSDYVSEFLFYAHASPDPQMVMEQLEDISRRTEGDKQLKIAHDDDSGWPFNWYLRDWPNATYFGATPSREVLADAPVAIIGSKNLDAARPFLQRDYYEFNYRLIWWPDEGYKNTSWEKIWQGITDPVKREDFLDVLLWRKYPTPMSQWPLVHRFSLFVRNDVAAKQWDFGAQPAVAAPLVDPYEEGVREVAALRQIGRGPGATPGQLSFPRNMAVADDGTVFVADSGNHRISVYGPDGAFLRSWGSSCELYADGQPGCTGPEGDGQMREPWGIALGPQGNVYVADTWNHRILVFDQLGNFLGKWGTFATTDGQAVGSPGGFWGPRAIAFDAVGNLYVTDTGNKRIQVFDADGAFLGQFGGGGVIEGRLDEPVGLALVPAGDNVAGGALYVADTWNRRVQEFEVTFPDELSGGAGQPSFAFVKEWPIEGWSSQSVVNKPYLAVDSEGFVYVTDPESWRVLVFDSDGDFVATFGIYGADPQGLALPVGVAIGPDDNVYVADSDNHRIQVFAPVR